MNRKGQALVEFVLILPVFIMILFVIIDFGMIFNKKSTLENSSTDIVDMFKNKDSLETIQARYPDLNISTIVEEKYLKITITDSVDLITPGLNYALEDPYPIKVERVIPNV